ncbi:MAG: hypothetical protein WED00_17665 [Aquisalimonadaceae bacterium]
MSSLLIVSMVVSGMISMVGLSRLGAPGNIAMQLLGAALFSLLFVRVALQFRGGVDRFLQTATALFATDAALTVIALPATAGIDPATQEASVMAAGWLLIVLLWTVAVIGHIFRNALDLPLAGGILVALVYLFLSINITSVLA